jgi:hypothetical protein
MQRSNAREIARRFRWMGQGQSGEGPMSAIDGGGGIFFDIVA